MAAAVVARGDALLAAEGVDEMAVVAEAAFEGDADNRPDGCLEEHAGLVDAHGDHVLRGRGAEYLVEGGNELPGRGVAELGEGRRRCLSCRCWGARRMPMSFN